MYFIDTNILLEIALKQEKSTKAKAFLINNAAEKMYMSDMSIHSIGIILFKLKKRDSFIILLNEISINRIAILSILVSKLNDVKNNAEKFNLDFDDAYQYTIAKNYDLKLISFDKDFDKTDIKRIEP